MKKKKMAFAIAVGALLIAVLVATVLLLKQNAQYQEAEKLFNSGEFALAQEAFRALGDYKDAQEMGDECRYRIAESKMELNQYSDAKALFEELGSYKESGSKGTECSYQLACQLLKQGQYDEALSQFQSLGDFKLSKQYIEECKLGKSISPFVGEWESVEQPVGQLFSVVSRLVEEKHASDQDVGKILNAIDFTGIKLRLTLNINSDGTFLWSFSKDSLKGIRDNFTRINPYALRYFISFQSETEYEFDRSGNVRIDGDTILLTANDLQMRCSVDDAGEVVFCEIINSQYAENSDVSLYKDGHFPEGVQSVPTEVTPQKEYYRFIEGHWDDKKTKIGDAQVGMFVFDKPLTDCQEMTVNINVEMNSGTHCKNWILWGRQNGSVQKLGEIYLSEGGGFISEPFTFNPPISIDAIAVTPTTSGGYSWSLGIAVTDVWLEN